MKRWYLFAPLALVLVAACGLGASSGATSGGAAPRSKAAQSSVATTGPYQTGTAPNDSVTTSGPRIVKNAVITEQVKNLDSAVDGLMALAGEMGGYVSGTNPAPDTGTPRSGTVTFVVPSDRFEEAVGRARGLGKVEHIDVSGQDVSTQYVDLQARLKNAQAQLAFYNSLLQKATTIQDMIAIENQIGPITQNIEQLEGQIAYLDHATAFSTVSVRLHEAAPAPAPVDSWGFKTAALDSLHGFVNTVDWIVVGLGSALPVLLILGLLGFGFWRWTRRSARAAHPAQSA
jgi:Domain of unknown function (DUF4349)